MLFLHSSNSIADMMVFRSLTSTEPIATQSGPADKRSPARPRPRAPASLPPAPLRGSLALLDVRSFGVVRHDTKKSLWPRTHYLLQIREMATEQHLMKEAEARRADRRRNAICNRENGSHNLICHDEQTDRCVVRFAPFALPPPCRCGAV